MIRIILEIRALMARYCAIFCTHNPKGNIFFVGVPSVIPQGLFAPKADGIGIVDDFSNTPTAKILWRFLNLTHGTKGATKMKRLLTAGIFGTILGIVSAGTANASIVSSGFLDEKLTEYALSTSLDLKANQTDLTALSNKIGTLPSAILPSAWTDIPYYSEYGVNMPDAGFPLPPTLGEQLRFLFNGADAPIERMFRAITMTGGNVNANDDSDADFLGLHPLTRKVSSIEKNITLPDGLTVANLYNGWTDSKGVIHNGLNDLSTITNNIDLSVEGPIAALMGYENGHKTRVKAVLNQLFMPIPEHPNLYNLVWHILEGGAFPKFAQEMYGIPGYKGLVDLTKGVGDLPSGNFPPFIGSGPVFPELNQPLTYPTSLAELINAIYGNSETGAHGLLEGIIGGFPYIQYGDDRPDDYIGLIHNFEHARNAKELASANATKIGDLPTEYATVGAALIAMDAKITAKNLPSTSDDGQYVLTAKKVGETITYTWVKMDLTNEEQIQ